MTNKPPGYKAFNDLTKMLIQVPKKELDSQVAKYEAKKAKAKAKPKKTK
jgi:hypothetical protein